MGGGAAIFFAAVGGYLAAAPHRQKRLKHKLSKHGEKRLLSRYA
jgi:hypothetical protein